jgi:hypothetical protein
LRYLLLLLLLCSRVQGKHTRMIHSLAPTRHTTHSNRNVNMMAGMHVGTGWCVCARWWVVGVGLFINTIDAVAGRASLLRLEPLHLHTRGHPRPQWVVARLGAQHWSETPPVSQVSAVSSWLTKGCRCKNLGGILRPNTGQVERPKGARVAGRC